VFYNLLPKPGEYSHARGSATLSIYCLLKQLKFDLSTKRSIKPLIDINSTLLKRMRAREHVPAPQPPPIIPAVVPESSSASSASFDSYSALFAQLREHDLKMSANFQKIEKRVDNDLQYICASIRYLQTCVDDTYSRNAWPVPLSRGHSQPLPTAGLLFDT